MADNGKWSTVRIVVAQVMKSLGPRANFGVAIFPNPNQNNACAPGLQVMSVRQGDAPAGTQGPTTSTMLAVTAASPERRHADGRDARTRSSRRSRHFRGARS